MIDQINELPEDGLKSSPETLRKYMGESKKYISCTFLHLIDILNNLNFDWFIQVNINSLKLLQIELVIIINYIKYLKTCSKIFHISKQNATISEWNIFIINNFEQASKEACLLLFFIGLLLFPTRSNFIGK